MKIVLNDDSNENIICEIEYIENWEDFGVVEIDGKLASFCSYCEKTDTMRIEYIDKIIGEKVLHSENEITCPNCSMTLGDSCEYGDEDDLTCDSCNCEFSFSREIEVTYSMSITKEAPEIKKLEIIKG